MRKPEPSMPKPPKGSPLEVRVPCVFCGTRLSLEDKKTHACWIEKKERIDA